MREISTGNFYICKECGKEYFISWEENGCQCCGCVSNLCPECEEKEKEETK